MTPLEAEVSRLRAYLEECHVVINGFKRKVARDKERLNAAEAALREMTDYAGGFEAGLHDDDKERHRKFIARARALLEGKP